MLENFCDSLGKIEGTENQSRIIDYEKKIRIYGECWIKSLWMNERKGIDNIVERLDCNEMQAALGEDNTRIMKPKEKKKLKERFRRKFQISHPIIKYLLYKDLVF